MSLLNQEDFLSPSENLHKKSKSIIISIDLEDFTYDTLRNIGITPRTNTFALDKCYEVISQFSNDLLFGKKLTFFTTGTLAREYPELIKRISDDGHEIASHYNYHDLMYTQSLDEIERNLIIARDSIFAACGIYPEGFRAPSFSILPFNWKVYQLISKYFSYDSSFVLHEAYVGQYLRDFKEHLNPSFREYPIVTKQFFNKFNLKTGGTFFRLFPLKVIKKIIEYNLDNGFLPQIYLHPYDLLHEKEFLVELRDFQNSKLGFSDSFIKYIRQYQWLNLRNKSTLNKLAEISSSFNHIGPYAEIL